MREETWERRDMQLIDVMILHQSSYGISWKIWINYCQIQAKPDIEMRSKVVYSLRQDSKIYQDSRILLFMAIQKVSSLQGIKDYTD